VKTAATTLRANPALDVEKIITELAVGEALVSFLDEKGRPSMVERAFVLPPHSRIGPVTSTERTATIKRSLVAGVYEQLVDRESAYEVLKARHAQTAAPPPEAPAATGSVFGDVLGSVLGGGSSHRQSAGEAMVKSAARAIGSEVGRQLMRGVLGSMLGRPGRRR
jgi:hypothetical protein